MSSLIFGKLRFKNIQSYGNEETIIDFNTQSLTLLIGGNGDGKSTIVDALNFVLFGRPYRKIKIGDLVNRINKKNLLTDIEIIHNNQKWRIIRGLSPQRLEIYKDEELQPKQDIREMQDFIEKNILGFDEKIFRQIVTLGSGYYVPFLKLPLAQKREIIEQLFELDIFSKMKVLTKDRLSKQEVKLYELTNNKKIIDNSISLVRDELNRTEQQNKKIKESAEEKKKSLELQIENKKKDIDLFKKIISQCKIDISTLKPKDDANSINIKIQEAISNKVEKEKYINELVLAEIKEFHKEIEVLENKKNQVLNTIGKIDSDIFRIKDEYHENKTEQNDKTTKEIFELKQEYSILENDKKRNLTKLKFYQDNTICPTCQSEITGEKIQSIVAELNRENADIDSKIQVLCEKVSSLKSENEKIISSAERNVNKKIDECIIERSKICTEKDEINRRIEQIRKSADERYKSAEIEKQKKTEEIDLFIEQQRDLLKIIENINKKIKIQEEEIKRRESDITISENFITTLEKQIDDLKNVQFIDIQKIEDTLSSYRKTLSDILQTEKKEKIIQEYLKMIENLTSDSGIKTQIIKHYLPIVQLKINEYLSLFQAEYTIELTEEFDVKIKLRQTEYVDYDNFSGGEKIRIDLALMFSFVSFLKMKTGAVSNLLFFDEILDSSLDMNGISALVQILKIFSDNGFSIFVVSHRKENQSEDFDKVFEIQKNIFSTIKEI